MAMADMEEGRTRGRDESGGEEDDDFLELTTYPSWSEVDMLAPRLEDDGIRYEARETPRNPEERSDGLEPRANVQIMVPRSQLRQARDVLEDFEAQRDVTNFEATPRPEAEDIGRPDDMQEPPQPKMKF
jgi:hypothetical protein